MKVTNNVLFEIGIEELPARFIDDAEIFLADRTKQWLEELRIDFDAIHSFSTPRRLAVVIENIADVQTSITEEIKGPAEKIAKDADGNWTKAAIGFTKGQGKSTEDIYLKEEKGTNYIFIQKHIEGQETKSLLPGYKTVIESIPFKQNMRWDSYTMRYARPIRWLVALYNNEVIPFEIAGVCTGRVTNGHRFLGGKVSLSDPFDYEAALRESYVIVNKEVREQIILEGIQKLEAEKDFHIGLDLELLHEVRNLVEYPTVFYGEYDEAFLDIPAEVLITSMKEHQRYFPVMNAQNQLLPYFISVRNGDADGLEIVRRGNEKVLRARLADAKFFYEEDQKQSISFYQEKLEKLVFQEKLGTVSEKVNRVTAFVEEIGNLLKLDADQVKQGKRAAEICKFDLMTNMVDEFPELQGIIGEKYARYFGEDVTTAQAIREHYLPIQASGDLPESTIGSILSIADKLDTIIGYVSVGLTPSGSQDPYGLRRQATGVLRILKENQWNIKLESLLSIGRSLYQYLELSDEENEKITEALHHFFALRASFLLKEQAIEQDVIQAVFAKQIGVFSYQFEKAKLLSQKRNDEAFKPVQEALVRVLNIAKKGKALDIDEGIFETESEKDLFVAYEQTQTKYTQATNQLNVEDALQALSALANPIHAFFDNNMVMVDDEKLKTNRLSLLAHISLLIHDFADLSYVQWKQHA